MKHRSPVKLLQQLLNSKGYSLDVDGIYGNPTRQAVNTLSVPFHVKKALLEVGEYEVPGAGNNPRIIQYMQYTNGKYSHDSVPWCGAFVSWIMNTSGFDVNIKYPERAKEWASFGNKSGPITGAIGIKSRKGGGHVNIILGETADGKLLGLGGNQNDEVNISVYKKESYDSFVIPPGLNGKLDRYDVVVSGGEVKES